MDHVFSVSGMDCASCASTIDNGVGKLNGVKSVEINYTSEVLKVSGAIKSNEIISRVEALGYGISVLDNGKTELSNEKVIVKNFFQYLWDHKNTRGTILAVFLVLPGLIFEEFFPQLQVESVWITISSIFALVIAGGPVMKSAYQAVRLAGDININVLMTIASIGALLIGAHTEAAVVMVLFAIGESMEGYTADKARNSIRELMALAPRVAFLLRNKLGKSVEKEIKIDMLSIGDIIMVKPGERIPMDGMVIAGASNVDQAPITGESKLVLKEREAPVYAGSMNQEGVLEIEITQIASDTVVSKLIKMVEEAQEKKAPSQRFVDRFAKIYTPLVVVFAALVVIVPTVFFAGPLFGVDGIEGGWLYKGLTLLVVACPCALVISTPVSIISAISNGANNGVLFKGGSYLEALSTINGIAFDKTGTLTKGTPAIVGVYGKDCTSDGVEDCEDCLDVLSLANAVESRSEHPLATAINSAVLAKENIAPYPIAENVQAIVGKGIQGTVGGVNVVVGSHTYFDESIPHEQFCEEVKIASQQGYSTMMVGEGNQYRGYITVADEVRENSATVVEELKKLGINPIVMLTGDNKETASQIASNIGIEKIEADCLPTDKVDAIHRYQESYGKIAMIGDGINDLPALASADIGIAVGNIDHALDTADITLMGNDLSLLPFAIRLSRKAMSTIRVNVGLSIGIKLAFLVLVLLGYGTMWMAVIADVGTSLLVSLLGMRLLKTPVR
jgi:Zn2+/Cd2+-exporting ATPase